MLFKLLLFIALLPMIDGVGIEISFSAEDSADQYASIDSIYDVEENVAVEESATASFDEFGITDTRTVSGEGIRRADQRLTRNGGYSSQSRFTSQGYGHLRGDANLKQGCLCASQNAQGSGLFSHASLSAANNEGDAIIGCSANNGSFGSIQRASMSKPKVTQVASVNGLSGSVTSSAFDFYGNMAISGAEITGGYLEGVQNAWSGSADTSNEIHASADEISAWSQGSDGLKESLVSVNLKDSDVLDATFDGKISSYAGHSTGAIIDSHIVGALESTGYTSDLAPSTRSSNGRTVEADLYIYAHTPGDGITDLATFYANPSIGIQPAIDASLAGDKIRAGPGVYHEKLVIYKQVNLQGAGSGSDNRTNTLIEYGSLTDPVINITAGGRSAADRTSVKNLRVNHLGGADPNQASGEGILISGPEDISHVTLEDIFVANQGGRASEITIFAENQRSITDVVLDRITIDGTSDSKFGLYIVAYGDGSSVSGVSVNDPGIWADADSSVGVLILPSTGGRIDDVSINGGNITSTGKDGNGVAIWSWGDPVSNIRISGTNILARGTSTAGEDSYGNGVDVTGWGITNVSVHNSNLIAGNYGLHNSGAELVNATDNWWGDASGPLNLASNPGGKGSKASDDVSFDPWSRVPK